ncbi:DUF6517 family protein [Natrinema longum]|uniref:Uncharacterized protein n=1 Tax=Natrinema longum TaxID=370324 RepID=A0A8A2UC70_9EURY|nr:DUF6517 family protein [Natrinema longum]MBZ6496613.1 hypothetical protein [Natrinema longum]QSW85488.1 hypothetical protein J0X27_01185 [Natrinema longum]
MTLSRRSVLATGAAGTLTLTAGCLGFVLGNEPLEFDADQAAPADGALENTGYSEETATQETLERTEEIGGVERDFEASIWTSTYLKTVDYGGQTRDGSAFAAVSVPGMEVVGQSVNPLDEMSNKELLEQFLSEVDGEHGDVRDIQHENSFSLEILDDSRDVDTFVGTTDLEGESIDVEIKITSFDHESDLLVLLGVFPETLTEESANVELLMESAEHPVEN